MSDSIERRAAQWIVGRDTATSSETIWAVMHGVRPFYQDVPCDPDDFGRCHRLLEAIPEWRDRLPEVAVAFPQWALLVEAWDELSTLYQEVTTGRTSWDVDAAKRMYDRMRELRGLPAPPR